MKSLKNCSSFFIKLFSLVCSGLCLSTQPIQAETNILTTTEALWQQPSIPNGFDNQDPFSPLKYYKGSVYFVWVDASYRPWVTQITNGVEKTSPIEPNDYTVQQEGHNRFSLGVDTDGYIHVAGDMHNYSEWTTTGYIPRMQKQRALYWKSNLPGTIDGGFHFAGALTDPTAMQGSSWTYPRFFNDNNGKLYYSALLSARDFGNVAGHMGAGLFKYDTNTKAWTAIGGKPDKISTATIYNDVFYWENAGFAPDHWFQGYRPTFFFDKYNRMHFAISGNTNPNLTGNDRVIYAYSDDEGATWKKANGTLIPGLPIRGADGTANQGDVVFDARSNPNLSPDTGILVDYNQALAVNGGGQWYEWNGSSWNLSKTLNFPQPNALYGVMSPSNSLLTVIPGMAKFSRMQTIKSRAFSIDLSKGNGFPEYTGYACLDTYAYRKTGVMYGIGVNRDTVAQTILKTSFEVASLPTGWADQDIANPLPSYAGLAAYKDGVFTVYNYGSCIDDAADNMHFVYKKMVGNCSVIAKVNTTLSSAQGYCRAGLMIRETLTASSLNVNLILAPGTNNRGLLLGGRTKNGSFNLSSGAASNPSWVKLVRSGDTFSGYTSADGIKWVLKNKTTVPMNQTVYVGLAAAAITNNWYMQTVEFSNVSVANQ
jgi:regulation of enolase protein 1 (concanavalin A-like superfamily)